MLDPELKHNYKHEMSKYFDSYSLYQFKFNSVPAATLCSLLLTPQHQNGEILFPHFLVYSAASEKSIYISS